ncbi:hypothetical protein NQ314_015124 [Rhamnusium bicolor]|uniref:CYTH domain-containing protein n=1 Tax=Rhamnusium bicolor TaxID=1586634 RepID=A0AAV8X083_9CUCU|nr:hypothetical protein NQ314_015124 [Rhamnusium bicolor]
MRNIEIKARVRNLNAFITKAKCLSKKNGEIIKQDDTFFNVLQGRLKLRKFEDGDAELIYYERPDTEGPKLSSFEKVNITSESVEGLNSILKRALGTEVQVHADSVDDLGDFVELEVVLRDDQSPEDGQIIALDLMEKLEISNEDLMSGAYADLLNK